jgi:hypothetical protein
VDAAKLFFGRIDPPFYPFHDYLGFVLCHQAAVEIRNKRRLISAQILQAHTFNISIFCYWHGLPLCSLLEQKLLRLLSRRVAAINHPPVWLVFSTAMLFERK